MTTKKRCNQPLCNWCGNESCVLMAPNPFDDRDLLLACPRCRSMTDLVLACEIPGCTNEADCGWPDGDTYRQTCGKHMKQDRPAD